MQPPPPQRPGWHSVVAGGTAGFATRLVVSPFDVLKIRAQLQVENTAHPDAKYRGTFHAASTMLKEEGVSAFWKGHAAGQLLSISYGAVQFGMYPVALSAITEYLPELSHASSSSSPSVSSASPFNVREFAAGGIAAGVATTAVYPFDVLRTRFVGQLEPKVYVKLSCSVGLKPRFYLGPRE
eukprot:gene4267-23017_t